MASITTRSGKGSPLTNAEVDANFTNLNDKKVEKDADTGAAFIPVGTEAQRPGSPAAGMFRFNDDTDAFEGYDGAAWGAIGGAGAATKLLITNRSGTAIEVPLTNGFLAILNRAGSTINVPVS